MADPSFQRLMLRVTLALPRPLLRGLAGGSVVFVGGRTLDPRMQFLTSQAKGAPPLSNFTPQEARVGAAMMLAPFQGELDRGVRVEPLAIAGPGGEVPCRVYRPAQQDPGTPLMVFAHFGGG